MSAGSWPRMQSCSVPYSVCVAGTELEGLPRQLVIAALQQLEARGKARRAHWLLSCACLMGNPCVLCWLSTTCLS